MREADAAPLIAHFQQEVVSRLPPGVVGCLAIPFLTPAQLADPRDWPLISHPLAESSGRPGRFARRHAPAQVLGADRFLVQGVGVLLSVARKDLDALESWQMSCKPAATSL